MVDPGTLPTRGISVEIVVDIANIIYEATMADWVGTQGDWHYACRSALFEAVRKYGLRATGQPTDIAAAVSAVRSLKSMHEWLRERGITGEEHALATWEADIIDAWLVENGSTTWRPR